MTYDIGSSHSFSILFENAAGTATDPTSIRFFLREELDGAELEWTYNAAPVEGTHYPTGMNPITRASAGSYALSWVTRKPERQTGVWVGFGTVFSSEQQTIFVRHSDVAARDPRTS